MDNKYKKNRYVKDPTQDFKRYEELNVAKQHIIQEYSPLMIAILFLILVGITTFIFVGVSDNVAFYVLASIVCGYMALNIGANDVANNVGPAVGSKSITMLGAVGLAAVFEVLGAFIAGGDVTSTIAKGIITVDDNMPVSVFITAMFSALLSAAIWLNIATFVGAPVSTTHSIVGGVVGGGVAAVGFGVVNWAKMSSIAASWVISPVVSAFVAAFFYFYLRRLVLKRQDKISAATTWVPVYVALMSSGFTMYLMVKGLKKIIKFDSSMILIVGAIMFVATIYITRPLVRMASRKMENNALSVSKLFQIPLIISAALLSFAHGANDVANAIGPLSAIVGVMENASISAKTTIPFWVMGIGALGISVGLLLFGPKLIREVGENITRLDRVRASCVALSSALTVLIASWLGLPVSSTHIAVGGVFGVGLYRELIDYRKRKNNQCPSSTETIIARKLVRRRALIGISLAWVITVPASAVLSAGLYIILNNVGFTDLF
ncbi:MAG: inorganic phosphate transporter [Alphaproteobacteria bacterium]